MSILVTGSLAYDNIMNFPGLLQRPHFAGKGTYSQRKLFSTVATQTARWLCY